VAKFALDIRSTRESCAVADFARTPFQNVDLVLAVLFANQPVNGA
jgi:hypothetical protein